jgi:hypothetical protein
MWWVELTDIVGDGYWATWGIDEYKVKDSDRALHAVPDQHSEHLRGTYSKEDAEKQLQAFLAHPKISKAALVQLRVTNRGWEPLWDQDRERLGW